MPVVIDHLAAYLDPLTAQEYRIVPMSLQEQYVLLGTDNRDIVSDTETQLIDRPAWLRKHIDMPMRIQRIATPEWEARYRDVYGDHPFLRAEITSPVTDILKRLILVEFQQREAEGIDWLQKQIHPMAKDFGFELEMVDSVEKACELLHQSSEVYRDLILLSESTQDFFGAKLKLEKIARDKHECELQVLGTQSAKWKPELIAEYFRNAA